MSTISEAIDALRTAVGFVVIVVTNMEVKTTGNSGFVLTLCTDIRWFSVVYNPMLS